MSAEFGVTSGHSLYSTHRFREDTKHIAHIEGATPPAIYKSIRQSKKKIFVYFEKRV